MSNKVRYYLKGFFITGGLFTLFWNITSNADNVSISSLLLPTIFFGMLMTLSAIAIRSYSSELSQEEKRLDNFKIEPKYQLKTNMSLDEIKEKLQFSTLIKMKSYKLSDNKLIMNTKLTYKSIGEHISLELLQEQYGGYLYEIKSKCKNPLTVFDYGKNFENIVYINREVNGTITP